MEKQTLLKFPPHSLSVGDFSIPSNLQLPNCCWCVPSRRLDTAATILFPQQDSNVCQSYKGGGHGGRASAGGSKVGNWVWEDGKRREGRKDVLSAEKIQTWLQAGDFSEYNNLQIPIYWKAVQQWSKLGCEIINKKWVHLNNFFSIWQGVTFSLALVLEQRATAEKIPQELTEVNPPFSSPIFAGALSRKSPHLSKPTFLLTPPPQISHECNASVKDKRDGVSKQRIKVRHWEEEWKMRRTGKEEGHVLSPVWLGEWLTESRMGAMPRNRERKDCQDGLKRKFEKMVERVRTESKQT